MIYLIFVTLCRAFLGKFNIEYVDLKTTTVNTFKPFPHVNENTLISLHLTHFMYLAQHQ